MKSLKFCTLLIGMFLAAGTNTHATNLENSDKSSATAKKTRSETFVYSDKQSWEPAGKGVTRQVMGYDGQVMMVKVKFEKGAVGTLHTHYHTQTTYVASGKFEFTVGGETKTVEAGDGIYIEPDVPHSCTCLEAGMLIDCFSPMRADYLTK